MRIGGPRRSRARILVDADRTRGAGQGSRCWPGTRGMTQLRRPWLGMPWVIMMDRARTLVTKARPRADLAAKRVAAGPLEVHADHGRGGCGLCRGEAALPGPPATACGPDRDARGAGHPGLAAGQRPGPGGGG